jgi:hypothetical protein
MKKCLHVGLVLVSLLSMETAAGQQTPKTDRKGNSLSTVLNGSTDDVTIEYHSGTEWLQLKLPAGKDATVSGDRIRVSTTREDKAIITVDLPVQAGKKYQVAWNTRLSMWDFSPTP